MSTMSKYLKQKCKIQVFALDSSKQPILNQYGEHQYAKTITCKCRYEPIVKEIQVTNGAILHATSRYFLDTSIEPKINYLIDGKAILQMSAYVDSTGKVIGYEVYT